MVLEMMLASFSRSAATSAAPGPLDAIPRRADVVSFWGMGCWSLAGEVTGQFVVNYPFLGHPPF